MRAKIVLLTVIVFLLSKVSHSQHSTIAQPYENISWCIDQAQLNPGIVQFDNDGYIFAPCQNNLTVSGTKQVDLYSGTYVNLKPGFKTTGLTGNGYFHADVEENPINLAVFTPEFFDGQVVKYEKFEIGIQLPENINQAIENFVNEIPHSSPINPYNPEQIDVKAEFYHLQTQGNNATWVGPEVRYGFYYHEFERVTTDPDFNNWYWQLIPTDYTFRVRFATPEFGTWKGKVTVTTAAGVISSHEFYFYCNGFYQENTGFVKVGTHKRYLTRGDETFVPVGQNLIDPWCNDCYFDADGNPLLGFEPYLGYTSKPKTFMDFNELLEQYSDAGANYYRYSLHSYANDIEFEKLNDYTQRLHLAWELDRTIDKTKEQQLFMHLSLLPFYTLESPSFFYFRQWDWNPLGCGFTTDEGFIYHSAFSLNNATEFFTNADAIKYYKFKIRYLMARYGYSTNIALFEAVGEINNSGNVFPELPNCLINPDTLTYYKPYSDQFSTHASSVYFWQSEMARYIKQDLLQDEHLLSVEYAGKPWTGYGDFSFSSPYIDLNSYSFYKPSLQKYKEEFPTTFFYPTTVSGGYGKPLMFAETGPSTLYNLHECDNHSEFIKDTWISAFTGVCGSALNWNHQHDNFQLWENYGRLRSFIEGIDFDGESWYPDFDEGIEAGPAGEKKEIAELFCLRKPGGNNHDHKAIGVIVNKTYNYWTTSVPGTNDCNLSENNPQQPFSSSTSIDLLSAPFTQKLKLSNMGNFKKYKIEYYSTSTGQHLATATRTTDAIGRLFIEYPFLLASSYQNTYNIPIVAFKVYRSNSSFLIPNSESPNDLYATDSTSFILSNDDNRIISEEDQVLKIIPNPADEYLQVETGAWANGAVLTMFNPFGEVVLKTRINNVNLTLDISKFISGLYFICIEKGDIRKTEKLIIE